MHAALSEAWRVAREILRFTSTGVPTAVKVKMGAATV
jgi:hypothetical protein